MSKRQQQAMRKGKPLLLVAFIFTLILGTLSPYIPFFPTDTAKANGLDTILNVDITVF